jgi:hypothetical protein
MKELVEKLTIVEKETSAEKGKYDLFALFLREDSSNKWDILVSADWMDERKEEVLKYLSQKIQKAFTPDELFQISRIVIIEKDNPSLPGLQRAFNGEHGAIEIKDATFFGLQIKHAFLITSRRSEAA